MDAKLQQSISDMQLPSLINTGAAQNQLLGMACSTMLYKRFSYQTMPYQSHLQPASVGF